MRFHPAEDLFDAFALALAHGVACMAGRAPIESRRLAPFNHGDMRSDVATAKMRHEILAVVALIRAQRAGLYPLAPLTIEHRFGGLGFGEQSLSDLQVDAQAMAILHERMAAETKLRLLTLALAHELGIRISGRAVGGVGTTLATDVDHALIVWPTAGW